MRRALPLRPVSIGFEAALFVVGSALLVMAPNSLAPSAAQAAENAALSPEALGKAKRATLMVHVTDASGSQLSGSGCAVAERGVVVTNAHVLGMFDADSRPPQKIEVVIDSGESSAQTVTAKLAGVDRGVDLAALRIEGKNLPAPLPLAAASELLETQNVYVLGFPFGKKLGHNITVTKSTVSSLRKDNNVLKEVQLSGGVHPGNSGGPVVDEQGRLVGVSVAGVSGTSIGMAIPSEHVARFLAGRLDNYGTDIAIREGGKTKILYHLVFVDPLGRVKNVRIEHFQGPKANRNPLGMKRPAPRPDETPLVSAEVPYDRDGEVSGELEVEPLKDPKFVYWFRPVWVNGMGQEWFASELSGMTAPPVERKAANVKFAPPQGPSAPMELVNNSSIVVRMPDGQQVSSSLSMRAEVHPTYQSAKDGFGMNLKVAHFAFGVKQNGKAVKESEFKRIAVNAVKTSAQLELDTDGTVSKAALNVSAADADLRPALTELDGQLLQALELLAVPLPNGQVQPLQTFKVQRSVSAGMPGLQIEGLSDVKFKFQGTHELSPNVPAAVFDFRGNVRGPKSKPDSMSGLVYGRVEISPNTGVILRSKTDLKIDVDVRTAAGVLRVTSTMHGEYRPPSAPSARPGPLASNAPRGPASLAARRAKLRQRAGAPGAKPAAGAVAESPDPQMVAEAPDSPADPANVAEEPTSENPPDPPADPESKPQSPPLVATGDNRVAWTFKDQGKGSISGMIRRNPDATWTMSNSKGVTAAFDEWARNDEYVLLVDPAGKRWLRCFDDHLDLRNKSGEWDVLYRGAWTAK